MRAVIGSTFLIATLAGPFVAQAGAILHITPEQSTGFGLPSSDTDTLVDPPAGLAWLDSSAGVWDRIEVASASASVASVSESTFIANPSRAPKTSVPEQSMIAGGLLNLSAVLAGIHARHPSILRL
jgi:hypothetical protein